MCLSVWSFDDHPEYTLLLASNRDEYLARPTTPVHFWLDDPDILAGRDGEKGGTWLGITRSGRLAWLTNYREPSSDAGAFTRGELTTHFLQSKESPMEYLERLAQDVDHYNGFNLVVADLVSKDIAYLANRPWGQGMRPQRVTPGVHGLSNALLDTPWPKVELAKAKLRALLEKPNGLGLVAPDVVISEVLSDPEACEDALLPDTRMTRDWERKLSSIFVRCETPEGDYGTRSSTVVAVHKNGHVDFYEKYLEEGTWKDHLFSFCLQPSS